MALAGHGQPAGRAPGAPGTPRGWSGPALGPCHPLGSPRQLDLGRQAQGSPHRGLWTPARRLQHRRPRTAASRPCRRPAPANPRAARVPHAAPLHLPAVPQMSVSPAELEELEEVEGWVNLMAELEVRELRGGSTYVAAAAPAPAAAARTWRCLLPPGPSVLQSVDICAAPDTFFAPEHSRQLAAPVHVCAQTTSAACTHPTSPCRCRLHPPTQPLSACFGLRRAWSRTTSLS